MKLRHLWIILTVVGVLAGAGESAALAGSKDLPKVKTKKVSYGKKNMILCFPPEEREPEFKDKPFILFIHGGAWTPGGGSRDTFMPHCKYVAGLGYAAATMSYRLAPVHPYPAHRQAWPPLAISLYVILDLLHYTSTTHERQRSPGGLSLCASTSSSEVVSRVSPPLRDSSGPIRMQRYTSWVQSRTHTTNVLVYGR